MFQKVLPESAWLPGKAEALLRELLEARHATAKMHRPRRWPCRVAPLPMLRLRPGAPTSLLGEHQKLMRRSEKFSRVSKGGRALALVSRAALSEPTAAGAVRNVSPGGFEGGVGRLLAR